jgi:hypothetical protein
MNGRYLPALVGSLALLLPLSVRAADPAKTPTFTKDIAPIFQAKCESCHRADSMAPMSLVTYEEVRPWVRSIATRVRTRQMPPWHIDKTIGIQRFKNDRSLSDEQLATILAWAAAGAPKGDPNDMPAPKVWPDASKWVLAEKYGAPDLVIKSPDYTVPAAGQDAWWRPLVPTGLTEPRWVRAIEIRPATVKGRKVTHHALAYLRQQQDDIPKELVSNDPNVAGDGLFMEWAVGKPGDEMRPDSGRLMLPDSKILFEMHYHAIGEQVTDHVELGIYFYPKGQEPKHREVLALFQTIQGGSRGLDIPPHQVVTTENFAVLKENARIENFQAHMHLRGKGMSMEAIYADGRREMLSQVTDFNFNWHNMYIYADDAAPLLPKGTILHFVSWWDNTENNRSNPDPDQWVGWGDRTVDEMGHAWINITYLNDEDFKQELAKRKTATTTNNLAPEKQQQ